jgi:aryl-alcohol dehydrogenase-like predicted oxidoreductase
MQFRKLGHSPFSLSALGLGCMGMSEFYGKRDEEESIGVIHRALDLQVNFLDTADVYGQGNNEELVGKALLGRRDQVVLATKFANIRDAAGNFVGISGRPEYVKQACEASLRRLQVDTIDLYYQHRVDVNVPIEETVGGMSRLVEEGKVRCLGLSEAAPVTIRRAHKTWPISALQTEYSLWSREPEDELISLCRELEITFVPYSPLGRGFLTGRFKSPDDFEAGDWRRNNPRFQGVNFQRNLDLVQRIEEMAGKKGCKPAQLALAWVLAQGEDMVPIPGSSHRTHLEENLAAIEISLTAEDLKRIDEVAPKGVAAGDRYPEGGMKVVNR